MALPENSQIDDITGKPVLTDVPAVLVGQATNGATEFKKYAPSVLTGPLASAIAATQAEVDAEETARIAGDAAVTALIPDEASAAAIGAATAGAGFMAADQLKIALEESTPNVIQGAVTGIQGIYIVRGDDNGTIDCSPQLASALASGKKSILILGVCRHTSMFTVPARTRLLGGGLTSDSATRGPSVLLKDFNGTGVLFSGDDTSTDGVQFDTMAARTGDSVQVTGSRWSSPSLCITRSGRDGLRIGSDEGVSSINANLWTIGKAIITGCVRDGMSISHTNTTGVDATWPQGVPDCNAGYLAHLDSRANGRDGLRLGNTIDNVFGHVVAQGNGGAGVRFAAHARGNFIFKSYTEANVEYEGRIEAGAYQNVIWASRTATATSSWSDASGSNSNLVLAHYATVGNSDLNQTPWVWGAHFAQRSFGSSAISQQFVGSNAVSAGWRTNEDAASGSKMTFFTRKTGVGERDHFAIDENGNFRSLLDNGQKLFFGTGSEAFMMNGYGSPEGVVIGYRGSMFIKISGATPHLYIFEGADGANTGWVGK